MTDADLFEALIDLALQAGAAVCDVYAGEFAVAAKADASPVTLADTRAEAIILAGLSRIAPGVPVVAEEAVSAGVRPVVGRRFFLVDPLDGTKEFVSQNGEFTVNVALVEDGAPILGVVYAPACGRLYVGGRGLGAFRIRLDAAQRPIGREPIATRPAPGEGLCAVGSRSHGNARTDAFLARLPIAAFTAAGSSLKLCLVACGEADVYPRLGRTMEWDIAAGDAILRAAGGIVVDLVGAPLTYRGGADGGFANPDFVAWGDPSFAARHRIDAATV